MAVYDIVFIDGDRQNFLMEVPVGTPHSPLDILTEIKANAAMPCLETPLIEIPDDLIPDVILLSDGKLARRAGNKFYIKL